MSTPPPSSAAPTATAPNASQYPTDRAGLSPAERRDIIRELVAESGRLTRLLELLEDESADNAEITERRRELLAKRDEFALALDRVASDRYGVCAVCRAPIPYGRLLLRPESACCADCAAAL